MKKFDEKWEEGINSNPELWYTKHILELRNYRQQMLKGELVETPYVREQAEEVLTVARSGKPAFISGFHGSGKTMLAEKVARDLYAEIHPDEKNPAMLPVIVGDESVTASDFFGRIVLKKPDGITDEKFEYYSC